MMQYDPGPGDYSKDRHDLFADLGLEELLDTIQRAKPDGLSSDPR